MLDKSYFQNGHLTPAVFEALQAETLPQEDRILVLTHLENCSVCMDAYLDSLAAGAILDPPQDMEKEILSAVHAERTRRKGAKVRRIQYTKLAVAVCLTMVLSVGGFFQLQGRAASKPVKYEKPAVEQEAVTPPKPGFSFDTFWDSINEGFYQFADFFNFGNVREQTGPSAGK